MKKATKKLTMAFAAILAAGALTACGGDAAETAGGNGAAAETSGGTITFGTNPEFPPFEFVTASGVIGEFDGIDMAIAKQIGEDNGMEAKMESMEFDSLLIALQNGQIDAVIAGMTATDERRETVDFSTPYYTATQVMIVKEDSDIATAADMADKKICVIQGYTGEVCVQDMGYPYEAFKKGTEAVMELVNGKCDVVVLDSATAQKYVGDNEGLKIVEDASAFEAEEYAIAVQKGNTELLEKINKSVEKMLADGTINELAVKYTEEAAAE
ncbi:MAG: transporter substrate-binding domain-containing protein [Bacteroidales bacterium]|nr:transporter substrate-binding domain-containing protein [Bacteroidales bacterium]MCM1415010.1 transporter substrate-binding domain-containing protein [bacterium]MCM1422864.1 transporter substrate-binding domain-containing protein [bacterium]